MQAQPSQRPLLPRELAQRIPLPQYHDENSQPFIQAVDDCAKMFDPEIVSISDVRYAVPITVSLFLYRRDPGRFSATVVSSLGHPAAKSFGGHLAAAARDAVNAGDSNLLGLLAWKFESAALPSGKGSWSRLTANQTEDEHPATVRPQWNVPYGKLQQAFLKALDYSHGHLDASFYIKAALGYFTQVSKNEIPPADLWLSTVDSPIDESRPLMRMFCRKNALAWHEHPGALDDAKRIDHPFLKMAIERLTVQPRGKKRRKPWTVRNPFRKLAKGVGEEPRHGIPTHRPAAPAQTESPGQTPEDNQQATDEGGLPSDAQTEIPILVDPQPETDSQSVKPRRNWRRFLRQQPNDGEEAGE